SRKRAAISRAVFSIGERDLSFIAFILAAVCDRRIFNNADTTAKRLPYNFPGCAAALLPCQKESITNRTTAIEMHESATLKAGQGWANRTCRSKRRKSIT